MFRTKLILAFTVVLVMAAGLTVGRLSVTPTIPVSVLPATRPMHGEHGEHRPSWVKDLNLTVVQQAEIDHIWQNTLASLQPLMEEEHSIEPDREAAIQKLFTPDQLAAYNKIIQDSKDKRSELDKERKTALDNANAQTRALLDEGQQKIFDDWMKQQKAHHFRGPGGPRMGARATSNAATTQP
jgi:hypothetical protein